MKKILAVLLLSLSSVAFAQHGHYGPRHFGYHHRHWHPNYGWVVPAVIGGAVVYAATRPVVVDQPVVIQQAPAPVAVQQNCSPWTETQHADGTITRSRTCAQ